MRKPLPNPGRYAVAVGTWLWNFVFAAALFAVGVLMIVFRVRVARANDWFWNDRWGSFLKVPIESPPVLVVLMACLFFLAGLLLTLFGIVDL